MIKNQVIVACKHHFALRFWWTLLSHRFARLQLLKLDCCAIAAHFHSRLQVALMVVQNAFISYLAFIS